MNLIENGPVVIGIRGAENGELAVLVNNTLVHHTAFLAADARPCVLITVHGSQVFSNPVTYKPVITLSQGYMQLVARYKIQLLIWHACGWCLQEWDSLTQPGHGYCIVGYMRGKLSRISQINGLS